MNDLELIREFRAKAAQPDAEQEERARRELMEVIHDERGRRPMSRRRRSRGGLRRALALTVTLAALPAGYALAQGLGSSEVVDESGHSVGVSCPEADARFERAGVPAPTEYADRCPTPEEIEYQISTLLEDAKRIDEHPGYSAE